MRIIKSLYFTLIISIFYCLIATSVEAGSMPWSFLLLDNNAPHADAGADQTVKTGVVVYLNGGNSSDADNDSLTYSWTIERPQGSSAQLSYSSNSSSAQFTPDVDGVYTLTLIVNDGKENSEPDTVIVTSDSNISQTRSMPWLSLLLDNNAPHADAGPDQTVKTGEVVYLDGGNSSDADNDSLTYNWTIERPGGSSAQLSYSPDSSSAQFTPDVDGTYTLILIVNDGKVNSAPDTLVVTSVSNFVPVADAGADQTVNTGELVSLDGSGSSDADGDTLTYYWSLAKPDGSSAILAYNASLGWAKFTPDIDGTYTLTLIVNDGKVSSAPDTVVITSR